MHRDKVCPDRAFLPEDNHITLLTGQWMFKNDAKLWWCHKSWSKVSQIRDLIEIALVYGKKKETMHRITLMFIIFHPLYPSILCIAYPAHVYRDCGGYHRDTHVHTLKHMSLDSEGNQSTNSKGRTSKLCNQGGGGNRKKVNYWPAEISI